LSNFGFFRSDHPTENPVGNLKVSHQPKGKIWSDGIRQHDDGNVRWEGVCDFKVTDVGQEVGSNDKHSCVQELKETDFNC
jgi:hypothetical protein